MNRTLSSFLTFPWKFIFPAVWIAGFGAGTVALWLDVFRGRDNQPPPDWMRWEFITLWAVGSGFLLWFSRRLCRVSISDNALFASNYFRHITVPLAAILRVRQSYMSRPQTITIYLDRQTELGRRIVFIPHGWPHFISRHPVTDSLNAIVERFRPSPPHSEVAGTPWAENPDYTIND